MTANIDYITTALVDPDAPWYGSDLVPAVADLVQECDSKDAKIKRLLEVLKDISEADDCWNTSSNCADMMGSNQQGWCVFCLAKAALTPPKEPCGEPE